MLVILMQDSAYARYLQGQERLEFIRGVMKTCNSDRAKSDPNLSALPAHVMNALCICYAARLVDGLTAEQLRAEDPNVVGPVVKHSMNSCVQDLAEEVLRQQRK